MAGLNDRKWVESIPIAFAAFLVGATLGAGCASRPMTDNRLRGTSVMPIDGRIDHDRCESISLAVHSSDDELRALGQPLDGEKTLERARNEYELCLIARNKYDRKAIKHNEKYIKRRYLSEWEFNRSESGQIDDGDSPRAPRLGVALSGGGVRAATYGIGALKALHDRGILDRVDVISAVSGGSYALYWYYSQMLGDESLSGDRDAAVAVRPERPFSSCLVHAGRKFSFAFDEVIGSECNQDDEAYAAQDHLENNTDIFGSRLPAALVTVPAKGISWAISIPYFLGTNLLFDLDLDVNPFARYYQYGIERTYGSVMSGKRNWLGELEEVNRVTGWNPIPLVQRVDRIPLHRIRETDAFARRQIPFFVIGATSHYSWTNAVSRFMDRTERQLSASQFEFTPLGYGSDSFGYYKYDGKNEDDIPFKTTLSEAVAISGAALDLPRFSALTRPLNLSLGRQIPNHNVPKIQRILDRMLPFPLYLLWHNALDRRNASIYLTDGGHSENLGLFALIRRGVSDIIVVDAEYDSDSKFDAALRLRRQIKRHLNADFVLNRPGLYDVRLDSVAMLGWVRNLPFNFKWRATCKEEKAAEASGDTFASQELRDQCHSIRIYYIKLGMDDRLVQRDLCRPVARLDKSLSTRSYPCSVTEYVEREREGFPHVTTASIEFSPDQVRAYRDLGFWNTYRHLELNTSDPRRGVQATDDLRRDDVESRMQASEESLRIKLDLQSAKLDQERKFVEALRSKDLEQGRRVRDLSAELAQARVSLELSNDDKARLEAEVDRVKGSSVEISQNLNAAAKTASDREAEIAVAQRNLENANSELNKSRAYVEELSAEVDALFSAVCGRKPLAGTLEERKVEFDGCVSGLKDGSPGAP